MIKNSLSRVLLIFLYSSSLAYTSDGYFVHRDQFSLNENEPEKKKFYSYLQTSNAGESAIIRKFKLNNQDEENRNIILGSFYAFYDDECKIIEEKKIKKVFLSGWVPTEVKDVKEFFKKEVFCLGSAYEKYPLFEKATDIFSIKRTSGKSKRKSSNSLSEVITNKLPSYNYKKEDYEKTFIFKLIQDFGTRGIDFEFSGGNIYNHQNHAHTEQAFFSYVENSLTSEDTFTRKDIPKSILVNMVSYLPICNTGFCLKSIKTLLSNDDLDFKYRFLKKIIPNLYTDHEQSWRSLIEKIRINVLFTSSDLPLVNNFGFIDQDQMLFKACN